MGMEKSAVVNEKVSGTGDGFKLWGNHDVDYEAYKEDFLETYPDGDTESDKFYEFVDDNLDLDYEDLMYNLNTNDANVGDKILCVGDLGRWNGRVTGWKLIDSGNICDCFTVDQGWGLADAEWWVDGKGDLRGNVYHHDGTNHLLYRAINPDAEEEDVNTLLEKIYYQQPYERDLKRLTHRLGDEIAKVYDISFAPEEKAPSREDYGIQGYVASASKDNERSSERSGQQKG